MMFTAKQLADKIGATLKGDASIEIKTLSAVDSIPAMGQCVVPLFSAGNLHFFENLSADTQLCVLTKETFVKRVMTGSVRSVFVHPYPELVLADLIELFFPADKSAAVIDRSAAVSEQAVISAGVSIGPNAVIESGVTAGPGCRIGAGAVICSGTVLGRNVVIGPNAVIGYEGFGFLPDGRGGIRKVHQAGGVVIGDWVEIGAGSCVDRGTIGNTVIGDNSKLDNQVQVGHNAKIGKNVIIAAQTGLAGSTQVKDGAMLGGQVGVADHLVIGAGAMVGAKSGVTKDVGPGQKVSGYPAMPRWQWLKVIARLKK